MTTQTPPDRTRVRRGHMVRLALFTVGSIAFLVYVVFGSVEARVWTAGNLEFENRSILGMWSSMLDMLPPLPGGDIWRWIVIISLLTIVLGTIGGLWLFLGESDNADDSLDHVPTAVDTHG